MHVLLALKTLSFHRWADTSAGWGNMRLVEPTPEPAKYDGRGAWKDGKHELGPRDEKLERKLFGTADDKETQHTGINFDKYKDIPVETKGRDVPASMEAVSVHIGCMERN